MATLQLKPLAHVVGGGEVPTLPVVEDHTSTSASNLNIRPGTLCLIGTAGARSVSTGTNTTATGGAISTATIGSLPVGVAFSASRGVSGSTVGIGLAFPHVEFGFPIVDTNNAVSRATDSLVGRKFRLTHSTLFGNEKVVAMIVEGSGTGHADGCFVVTRVGKTQDPTRPGDLIQAYDIAYGKLLSNGNDLLG